MKKVTHPLLYIIMYLTCCNLYAAGSVLMPPTTIMGNTNTSTYHNNALSLTPAVFMTIGGGYAFNRLMDDTTRDNQHLAPQGNMVLNAAVGYQVSPIIGYELGALWLNPSRGYNHVDMGSWLFDGLVDLTIPGYNHISFTAKLGAGWQKNNGNSAYTNQHPINNIVFKNNAWSAVLGVELNYRPATLPRLSLATEWLLVTSHIRVTQNNQTLSYFPSRNLVLANIRYDFLM